ncbi:MAG: aminotransferase class V-fold PLP-dependent enzyme [Holophagales bacterium]|nr:aminotransferase class V-fold PLP-dependent enzyme [Holophagales bacterium]MYD23858.1 aminotransferase class V-fold PLP-dependent enzyme [Holophagales bacterium]
MRSGHQLQDYRCGGTTTRHPVAVGPLQPEPRKREHSDRELDTTAVAVNVSPRHAFGVNPAPDTSAAPPFLGVDPSATGCSSLGPYTVSGAAPCRLPGLPIASATVAHNPGRRLHGDPVYLDYAATTPVDPRIIEAMSQCLGRDGVFGNPASRPHLFGREASEAVEKARAQVAGLIGADPGEIVWTSGATESVNLAIKGLVHAASSSGGHVVTSSMEHRAVLDTCAHLESEGYEVTYVDPDSDGMVTPERIRSVLREETILVSLMHVNNEVGTVTDVGAVGAVLRAQKTVLHVDAAQSAPRLPLDVRELGADVVSLSGHKMYGPKGVGALYVRSTRPPRIEPQMHGGEQEHGLRSGTLPTHQIVGMGMAAQLVRQRRTRDTATARSLDRRLRERLDDIPQTSFNGNQEERVPGIVNVSFACVDSEALMMALREDVAISSGSACTSARVESSHVLRALGVSDDAASSSVRFSLGRFTTEREVDRAAERVAEAVQTLRHLSPQWSKPGSWC